MAERSNDDLNQPQPPAQDDKDLPAAPERDTTAERGQDPEQIEEDQQGDDRFQATDN
jgi:hypothetical protein